MLKVLLLGLLVSLGAYSAPDLIVKNDLHSDFNASLFEEASRLFESEIGAISGDVTISVNPQGCLRTGYDRKTREVVFCSSSSVRNSGLQSPDVIHHELFHAFLCLYQSSFCGSDKVDYVHEALADSFAYKLLPDEYFGEDFYLHQKFIRKYKTTWRPELVQGEHERGNALASLIIHEGKHLKSYLSLFSSEINDPVQEKVSGVPYSRLNRYRLKPEEVMTIAIQIPGNFEVSRIEWEASPGIVIESQGPWEFQIHLLKDLNTTKAYAKFYSKDHKELGRRTYYFGRAF